MKKQILCAAIIAFAAVSCEKKPETVTNETATATETFSPTPASTDSAAAPVSPDSEASKNNSATVISTTNFEGDGKKLKADYMGDQAGTMSVKIYTDGKETILPQTEAWAKGAIYSDGKTEFVSNGQTKSAVLKSGGKSYNLKEVK